MILGTVWPARTIAGLLVSVFLAVNCASPAMAMSTAQEVAQGRSESAQIDNESLVVQDPFLVSWVDAIGTSLAQHRQRRDLQYHFIVLADPNINAFALKGGFVHVDLGLLNFVGSDDELASTMGHEMGHVELRHVVKSSNQGTVIGILTALASLFSPVAYVLGGIGSELAGDKFSRAQELQADHYGIALMAKAGYDPRAAVDVMSKLGAMDPGPQSRADKAFIDHPVPQDRISHLLGYPELTQPSVATLIAQAIHDQQEGRYSYASAKLKAAAATSSTPLLAEHSRQLDYALRESGGQAAPDGRVMLALTTAGDPRRQTATAALRTALAASADALTAAKANDRTAQYELDDLVHRIDKLAPSLQTLSAGPRPQNSAGGAPDGLGHLTRDISGTIDLLGDTLSTAPGLIGPNADTLREMAGPFADPGPLTPKFQALLAYYPRLTSQLDGSNQQLLQSIQMSRDAIAQAVDAVQTSESTLGPPPDAQNQSGAPPPRPNPQAAIAAWDRALDAAQRASNMMYAAQTAGLSAEITMLDVFSSPERYTAFRQALMVRFPGETPPQYAQALHSGVTTGDLACASWLAFDTKRPLSQVLSDLAASGQGCEQAALSQHLLGESMEIAEGLVYEDYVDAPAPLKQ